MDFLMFFFWSPMEFKRKWLSSFDDYLKSLLEGK